MQVAVEDAYLLYCYGVPCESIRVSILAELQEYCRSSQILILGGNGTGCFQV